MYFKMTIDEVINRLTENAEHHERAAAAWEKVVVAKKKNGDEFADLGRAITGARKFQEYGFDRIGVTFRGYSKMYDDDYIDIFGYCDELPDDDPRKVCTHSFLRDKYIINADELRARIADRIALDRKYAKEYRDQLKNARDAVKEFRDAVEKAEAKLERECGKMTLWYAIERI